MIFLHILSHFLMIFFFFCNTCIAPHPVLVLSVIGPSVFPAVQSGCIDILSASTPLTLQPRTLSSGGLHPSMSPTVWSISSLSPAFVNVCTPPPFVTIVSASALLPQPSSNPLRRLINLYSAALSLNQLQCFPPSSSGLSPHFHPQFPGGNHLKWCFITTFHRPTFPTAALHPLS